MKRFAFIILVMCCAVLLIGLPLIVQGQQSTNATAEAVGQANLRAGTDVNAALLGQITSGTRYPILGQSQFYPWLLLGDPTTQQPIGWVFRELVNVVGDTSNVPYTEVQVGTSGIVAATPTVQLVNSTPVAPINGSVTPSPVSITGVYGVVRGEINIRYGPGVDFPRVGIGREGERYEITSRHTQFPWVEIRYPDAPNGFGWVANDLLQIEGNIFNVPATSQTNFNFPTLTPTAAAVQASSITQGTPVAISPAFQGIGDAIWGEMLEAGFEPETSKLAAMFLMNLQTGEALTFGNQIAFSGMSLNKIPILATLYSILEGPPTPETALAVAGMMVCSENSASNALMRTIGSGDEYAGAQAVTAFMSRLGAGNTFIVAPFLVPGATPAPVRAPTTQADQVRAQPDYSNQMTVDNMGWLLAGIYQCAANETGILISQFPGAFNGRECRQMLDIMSDNNLGLPLMMSSGVPPNTRVAHKHGYINDTHGNAGIVFSAGGDYVLVIAMHGPTWLESSETFPLISDAARRMYNYLNPTATLESNLGYSIAGVDECLLASRDSIDLITSADG
ncbi:MAG: serine hydrolase [Anaerolineae bacterium]|nr:serine hydrolase [Anaerolineae bacterium]